MTVNSPILLTGIHILTNNETKMATTTIQHNSCKLINHCKWSECY